MSTNLIDGLHQLLQSVLSKLLGHQDVQIAGHEDHGYLSQCSTNVGTTLIGGLGIANAVVNGVDSLQKKTQQ